MTKKIEIVIVGSGNVAQNIGIALCKSGYNIVQVVGRNAKTVNKLATKLHAQPISKLSQTTANAQLYILSVHDRAYLTVLNQLPKTNGLVVHTAGSVNISVFEHTPFNNVGVFYPLQTFSARRVLNFSKIPICIEANTAENNKILHKIAESISDNVSQINSEQRKAIHVAAVFACNFSNHMYTMAAELLKQKQVPQNILAPLIAETARKIAQIPPLEAQTGPAKRNDTQIMHEHMLLLEAMPSDFQKIYKFVSDSIVLHHTKKD